MEWRGERDGSQGSHARGSRVKKLRNGIEFETCLRGSSEWRRCVPLPHSCIILAFVLTGYPASAGGGWGGKPPRLLQPAFPASRHALSREESLGPRFLVLDSHFSYHFAFAIILHAKFRHRIFEIRSVPGWKSGGSSRRRSMHVLPFSSS